MALGEGEKSKRRGKKKNNQIILGEIGKKKKEKVVLHRRVSERKKNGGKKKKFATFNPKGLKGKRGGIDKSIGGGSPLPPKREGQVQELPKSEVNFLAKKSSEGNLSFAGAGAWGAVQPEKRGGVSSKNVHRKRPESETEREEHRNVKSRPKKEVKSKKDKTKKGTPDRLRGETKTGLKLAKRGENRKKKNNKRKKRGTQPRWGEREKTKPKSDQKNPPRRV